MEVIRLAVGGNVAQILGARMRRLAPSYWLFWKGKSKFEIRPGKSGGGQSFTRAYVFLLLLLSFVDTINAHGRFIEPPSRVSSWRYFSFIVSIGCTN